MSIDNLLDQWMAAAEEATPSLFDNPWAVLNETAQPNHPRFILLTFKHFPVVLLRMKVGPSSTYGVVAGTYWEAAPVDMSFGQNIDLFYPSYGGGSRESVAGVFLKNLFSGGFTRTTLPVFMCELFRRSAKSPEGDLWSILPRLHRWLWDFSEGSIDSLAGCLRLVVQRHNYPVIVTDWPGIMCRELLQQTCYKEGVGFQYDFAHETWGATSAEDSQQVALMTQYYDNITLSRSMRNESPRSSNMPCGWYNRRTYIFGNLAQSTGVIAIDPHFSAVAEMAMRIAPHRNEMGHSIEYPLVRAFNYGVMFGTELPDFSDEIKRHFLPVLGKAFFAANTQRRLLPCSEVVRGSPTAQSMVKNVIHHFMTGTMYKWNRGRLMRQGAPEKDAMPQGSELSVYALAKIKEQDINSPVLNWIPTLESKRTLVRLCEIDPDIIVPVPNDDIQIFLE